MELKSAENEISEILSLYSQLRDNLKPILIQKVDVKDAELSPFVSFITAMPPSLEEILLQSSSITNTNNIMLEEENWKTEVDSYWIVPSWLTLEKDQLNQIVFDIGQLSTKIESMKGQMERLEKRLSAIDTVTGNPRYGEKTRQRVHIIILKYQMLGKAVGALCEPLDEDQRCTPVGIVLKTIIQQQEKEEAIRKKKLEEEIEQKKALQKLKEEFVEAERQKEELCKTIMKEEEKQRLAELAEKSRSARLEKEEQRQEEERRKREEERQADMKFENSVEKGLVGMKQQLCVLRTLPKEEYKICLRSLHTLFTQILSKPEEVQYRKIRRDHERFLQDIGRHAGGKEFLIAAGFQLAVDENEIPCLISKEPDIEKDMDGWSIWYNNIKLAVDVIDEELKVLKTK